jgi:hypothetical protein
MKQLFYYNQAMAISNVSTLLLPVPTKGSISLVIAPRHVIEDLTAMLTSLALNGQVNLIDGGNLFDGYRLARMIRKQTPYVHQVLDNVNLSRSFTCYQMTALLRELPANGIPLAVFDLLATFLDESVPFSQRRRLLNKSLSELQRISGRSPVALWVHLRHIPSREDEQLLPLVLNIAQDIWRLESPRHLSSQLSLF